MRGRFILRQNTQPEAELQEACVKHLRAYLPDAVKAYPGLSGLKLPPAAIAAAKRQGMERGDPDFHIILPGETRYVELKSQDGVLTKEQAEVQALVGDDQFGVCRTLPEFVALLSAWMAPHGLRWLTDAEAVQRRLRLARAA